MIDKREEGLFLLFREEQSGLKSPGGAVTPTKEAYPSQREAQPHNPTAGGVVEVHVGMCPWDGNTVLSWNGSLFQNHVDEVKQQEVIMRLHPEGARPGSSFPSS